MAWNVAQGVIFRVISYLTKMRLFINVPKTAAKHQLEEVPAHGPAGRLIYGSGTNAKHNQSSFAAAVVINGHFTCHPRQADSISGTRQYSKLGTCAETQQTVNIGKHSRTDPSLLTLLSET